MNRLTLLKDYRIVLGHRLAEFQNRKGNENKKMARFAQDDIDEVNKWMDELKQRTRL